MSCLLPYILIWHWYLPLCVIIQKFQISIIYWLVSYAIMWYIYIIWNAVWSCMLDFCSSRVGRHNKRAHQGKATLIRECGIVKDLRRKWWSGARMEPWKLEWQSPACKGKAYKLYKEWIVLQIVCKTEWNSWAETFEQWTTQICSDKFCDFWQTRDTKNLKRGWDWDFAEHDHSNCYTSLCSKFCLISCLLGWIDLGLLQWGQATKLLGHSSHASGLGFV